MAATAIETIPATWDDERDNAFFRVTASLFSCDFTYGAGVLLASYDEDVTTDVTATVTGPTATATGSVGLPSASSSHVASR